MNSQAVLLLSIFVFLGPACATSPLGRQQLVFVPDAEMNTMGAQAFTQMKTSAPIDSTAATNRYVNCVAMAIVKESQSQLSTPSWEVVVFEDKNANAFALPGGKIGVHTGIFKVAQSPDQLAVVLAHEVGHVIARHGAERVSETLAVQGGLSALGMVTKDKDLLLGLLGVGAQYGILLPHSRTQESEADLIGLDLMARAGFDPRASITLWQNMDKEAGGKSPPEFLSTHPSSPSRIENMQAHMGQAVPKFEQARAEGKQTSCHA
ncbi:M48 family metallopeptidase [Bdellovibrionota bacterium FG-2]